jgi:hypothetical protein
MGMTMAGTIGIAPRRYDRGQGELSVALRRSGVAGELAGLTRAAHFAGQAFGHEDVALPRRRLTPPSAGRAIWWLVAVAALVGLAVLAFGRSVAPAAH